MTNKAEFLYFETGSADPYYNLAFEEYVFDHYTDQDVLILWQNDNTVVIGKNQITEQQINRDFVEEHRVNVVRRMTGGGAVYHDMGNLNYSFITDDVNENVTASLEQLAKPVVNALRALGLNADVSGRNDILIDGLKVSGTAQRAARGRLLHHGTLLFRSDPDMIAGALKVDQEKFRGKGIKSVKSRVGNIAAFLDQSGAGEADEEPASGGSENKVTDMPSFWQYLKTALLAEGQEPVAMTDGERQAIGELADTKYRTHAWNYGRSPHFEITNRRYLDGGLLETTVDVKGGKIEAVRFYGDFLARRPLDEIEETLAGVGFDRDSLEEALGPASLEAYFGGIKKDDIIETILMS